MHLCCHLLPTGVGDPTSTIRLEDSIMDSLPRPWRSVHDGNPRFESSNAHRPGRCANPLAPLFMKQDAGRTMGQDP